MSKKKKKKSQKPEAMMYCREIPKGTNLVRMCPDNYEEKFGGLIDCCAMAKSKSAKHIVISFPEVLGDNMAELLESIRRISEANLSLHIATPTADGFSQAAKEALEKPELMAIEGTALAYGNLFMDSGECSWEYAELQIDKVYKEALKKAPAEEIIIAFDLTATKSQIDADVAEKMAQRIIKYIDEKYPEVGTRLIGITADDDKRPLRDLLILRKQFTEKDYGKYFCIIRDVI